MLLAVRGAGEPLGELTVLDSQSHMASVVAAETCHIHIIPAADFLAFVHRQDLLEPLLRHAIGRLREAEAARRRKITHPVVAKESWCPVEYALLPDADDVPQEHALFVVGIKEYSGIPEAVMSPARADVDDIPSRGFAQRGLEGEPASAPNASARSVEPPVSLIAKASGRGRIYQSGHDMHVTER